MCVLIFKLFLLFFAFKHRSAPSTAILAIDFDSESITVSSLVQGKGISIMLDSQSKRRIPATIYFDEDTRYFGNEAMNSIQRKPENSISKIKSLIGFEGDNQEAKKLHLNSFGYSLLHKNNKFIVPFNKTKKTVSPAESFAMILKMMKNFNLKHNDHSVKKIIVAVPSFSTQKMRLEVLKAVSIADLETLSLINENAAIATQYCLKKRFEKKHRVLIFNMGYSKTEVSVYEISKVADKKTPEKVRAEEVSYTFDDNLGGVDYDRVIVDFFIQKFAEKNNFEQEEIENIKQNKRAIATLVNKAIKIKKTLNSNKEASATIDNFYKGKDLRGWISKKEFEERCLPINKKAASLLSKIRAKYNSIVFVGGATRVHSLRSFVEKAGRKPIEGILNEEDTIALGAGFQAATLSTSFRLHKNVQLVEKSPYSIEMMIEGISDQSVLNLPELKKFMMAFNRYDKMGESRSVSFETKEDFNCKVYYGAKSELPKGQKRDIFSFKTFGVKDFYLKNKQMGIPKVNIILKHDQSGILKIEEAIIFFKGFDKIKSKEKVKEDKTFKLKKEDKNKEPENKTSGEKITKNASSSGKQIIGKEKEENKYYRDLNISYTSGHPQSDKVFYDDVEKSKEMLVEFDKRDAMTKLMKEKINDLESIVYKYSDYLEDSQFLEYFTETEEKKCKKSVEETENWMMEKSGELRTAEVYVEKFEKQKSDCKEPISRIIEASKLESVLVYTKKFLDSASKIVEKSILKKPWISKKKIEDYNNTIKGFNLWLQKSLEEAKKLPKNEDKKIKSDEVAKRAEKIGELAMEFEIIENIPKNISRKRIKDIRSIFGDIYRKVRRMFRKTKLPVSPARMTNKEEKKDQKSKKEV